MEVLGDIMSVFKIQVFRVSDGEQLYGLHADDSNRVERLAAAMLLHTPPLTTLVDEDITAEEQAKKDKVSARKAILKDKRASTKDRVDAIIEHLGLDL